MTSVTLRSCAGPISLRRCGSLRDRFGGKHVCRNIKTLFNFDPPATDEEVRAASLQFVRKLSGTTKPSKVNEVAFGRAVDDVTVVATVLLDSLMTSAPTKNREAEAVKARARTARRFGTGA